MKLNTTTPTPDFETIMMFSGKPNRPERLAPIPRAGSRMPIQCVICGMLANGLAMASRWFEARAGQVLQTPTAQPS